MRPTVSILAMVAAATASWQPARAEVPDLTAERWKADIRYLAAAIPTVHKNAFHHTNRAEFDVRVQSLLAQADEASDEEMVVGIQQLIASIGDGHSFLSTGEHFRYYPFELLDVEGEMRIVRAADPFKQLLGSRIVAIDGMPIAEARRRIRTLIPQAENPWYVLHQETGQIVRAEDLFALKISRRLDQALFTLQKNGEPESEVMIPSFSPKEQLDWTDMSASLLSYSHADQSFWFGKLPGTQAVYVNFRWYENLEQKARQLFDYIDQTGAKALVIDLRFNGGGNFTLPQRFIIPEIRRRSRLLKPGRLFVLVGRRTFSAAMTNAIDFKGEVGAVLVGEPIGARPNGYQENGWITLPNSGLRASLSTMQYRFWESDIDTLNPDVMVPVRWSDFRDGADPALDYVTQRLRR